MQCNVIIFFSSKRGRCNMYYKSGIGNGLEMNGSELSYVAIRCLQRAQACGLVH